MLNEDEEKILKLGENAVDKLDVNNSHVIETLPVGYEDSKRRCSEKFAFLLEKVANLPARGVQAYFRGLREIVNEIKEESDVCKERIHYLKLKLPKEIEQIKKLRLELMKEKNLAVEAINNYKVMHNALLRRMNEEAPDLIRDLGYYSYFKNELQLLQFIQEFLKAKKSVRVALDKSDIASLRGALIDLQGVTNFPPGPEELKFMFAEKQKLLDESEAHIREQVLKFFEDIRYPFDSASDFCSSESRMDVLLEALMCYCDLKSGDETLKSSIVVLPLLFEPFVKRFDFHFFSKNRKTNVDDKPEWYFALLFSWLTANTSFLEKLYRRLYLDQTSVVEALEAFQIMLIDLAKKKTRDVLGRVLNDSVLFAHLIDEVVFFENDLRESGILLNKFSILEVFCEDKLLSKWLDLEIDSCRNSVEVFLSSEARWKQRYREVSDTDEFRVPECADQFVLLLDSITERYRSLPDVKVQAKFFAIQVLMLEEFHLRLVQISQQLSTPWEKPFMQVLNSFWYISCVMDEWADSDVFLRIQMTNSVSRVRSVFVEIAEMYKHVWRQRASDMCDAFVQHIKSQLIKYKSVKWFALEVGKPFDLTPSFCPFFLEVRRLVGQVASTASPDSVLALLRMLNLRIAEALSETIKGTSFNCNGASQMLFDISSSLLPVLNFIYADSTSVRLEALDEPVFQEVIVCLQLLSLPVPTAILLRDELKHSPEEMATVLLSNYNASFLERDRVLEVFKQRCDIELDYGSSVKL